MLIGAKSKSPVGAASAGVDYIIETTTQKFAEDVLKPSLQQPVIVDFWAPWCGPCKQLMPVLEKLVKAHAGAIRLVKVNIDEHPMIGQQLGVQSVPTVLVFMRGQPIDGFAGAQPEPQLKLWLDGLLKVAAQAGLAGPAPTAGADLAAQLAAADAALAAGDAAQAQSFYAAILSQDPSQLAALAGLIRCYLAVGQREAAQQLWQQVPAAQQTDKVFASVRAQLELLAQAAQASPLAQLSATVASQPDNHQARFDLALALLADEQRDAAVEQLLTLVATARQWQEEAARKQLLKCFEAFGPTDPLTIAGRKKLSSLLFR